MPACAYLHHSRPRRRCPGTGPPTRATPCAGRPARGPAGDRRAHGASRASFPSSSGASSPAGRGSAAPYLRTRTASRPGLPPMATAPVPQGPPLGPGGGRAGPGGRRWRQSSPALAAGGRAPGPPPAPPKGRWHGGRGRHTPAGRARHRRVTDGGRACGGDQCHHEHTVQRWGAPHRYPTHGREDLAPSAGWRRGVGNGRAASSTISSARIAAYSGHVVACAVNIKLSNVVQGDVLPLDERF